jgi:glutathione peroxidase
MKIDFDTTVTTLTGEETTMARYEGNVLLIVNTASKCGFTPQYGGLEKLHVEYAESGLKVLGFPCNQFGKQEPGGSDAIAEFCQENYGVSFPMYEKIDVNGAETHPLYKQLKDGVPGMLGSKAVKWNFTKFLVSRDGTVVKRYGPNDTPESIAGDIESELGKA